MTRDEMYRRFGSWTRQVADRPACQCVLDFFFGAGGEARIQRMEDAEIHHRRPPLAGVVRELGALYAERLEAAGGDMLAYSLLSRAAGYAAKEILVERGWNPLPGKKGSISLVPRVEHAWSPEPKPWITRGQRFAPPPDHPLRHLWSP